MKRKGWVIFLCCLMIAALLAGCKGTAKSAAEQKEKKTTNGNGTAQDDTAVPNAPSPSSLGVVNEDLTADRLFTLIGKGDTDIDDMMKQGATLSDDQTADRAYKTTVLGEDANIAFQKGTDKKIKSVTVTVSKTVADKWKESLKGLYGESVGDIWSKDDAHVQMTTSGDNVIFTVSKVAK